jgi:hypothetical protein
MKNSFLKILLYVGAIFLWAKTGQAQTIVLSGRVKDSVNSSSVENSLITIIRAKDSIILNFGRSGPDGVYSIQVPGQGKVVAIISYPGYTSYIEKLALRDSGIDMGFINIIPLDKLLEEVIVRSRQGAIQIRGDTTEYKADSFSVGPNANVEDLLKVLPGIQVDRHGNISARGQTVRTVLVDGEEFFGNDPTLVTRNLPADMIDKVQLYDKRSDQANFTGIDDGQRKLTINVTTKPNKRSGIFGKLAAGIGVKKIYENQLMINRFREKEKMAVFGIKSNIGSTGLNYSDEKDYSGNSDLLSGGFRADVNDLWQGNYNRQGLPSAQSAGAHYNSKWGVNRHAINANHKFFDLGLKENIQSNTQYYSPQGTLYGNQSEAPDNRVSRHLTNASYALTMDSTSAINVKLTAGMRNIETRNEFLSSVRNEDSILVNDGSRKLSFTEKNSFINGSLLWQKRFKKVGRTISVQSETDLAYGTVIGFLFAVNRLYNGAAIETVITDQYKTSHYKSIGTNTNIVYTEKLGQYASLAASFGLNHSYTKYDRSSFSKDASGKYNIQEPLFSNDYVLNQNNYKTGLHYTLYRKKYSLALGNEISTISFKHKNIAEIQYTNKNFVGWYPNASFKYAPNQRASIGIYYNGSTILPSIQQIQPIFTNNDPLNIVIGNSLLRPAFASAMRLDYWQFDALSGANISASVSFNKSDNAIINKINTDLSGKRTLQYINLDGARDIIAHINYGLGTTLAGLNIDFTGRVHLNRYPFIINDRLNLTDSRMFNFRVHSRKTKDQHYQLSLSADISYSEVQSSIETFQKVTYLSGTISSTLEVTMPAGFQLESDCKYTLNENIPSFDKDNNILLWNAWLSKRVTKNKSLLIKVSIDDILNNNNVIRRSISDSYLSQIKAAAIRRYAMLSITWNFRKNKSE